MSYETDSRLAPEIEETLLTFLPGEAQHVYVRAEHGVAILSGTVETRKTRQRIAHFVVRIPGVTGVADELADLESGRDADVRAGALTVEAVAALAGDTEVPVGRVKPLVSDGCATLVGRVWNAADRAAAERAVSRVSGLDRVSNAITLLSKPRAQLTPVAAAR